MVNNWQSSLRDGYNSYDNKCTSNWITNGENVATCPHYTIKATSPRIFNNAENYQSQHLQQVNEGFKNPSPSSNESLTQDVGYCMPVRKIWEPCGVCSTPRKSISMNPLRRCLKENHTETTTNTTSPKYDMIQELETPPRATDKESQFKSLGCLSSPLVECQSHKEECLALPPCQNNDNNEEKTNARKLRNRNPLYQKQHPQYQLFDDNKLNASPCQSNISECSTNMRCFIPHGHIDHFQTSNDCVCADPPRRLRIPHEGKEHHPATQRNPIVGIVGPKDILQPSSKRLLLGPPGFYYCSESCASQKSQEAIPMSEQRAQFASCKPWIARDIYSSTIQAGKDNESHSKSVHPSVNCFLYEDQHAIVQ